VSALFSDEELIALVKEGNTRAFELLVERYYKQIYAFGLKMVGDSFWAEELTHEAFLKLHKNIEKFDPRYRFKPWFFKMTANLAIDLWRKQRPKSVVAVEFAEERVAGPGPDAQEALVKRELWEEVSKQVEQLPPDMREAVYLRDFLGLSYQEMCEALSKPLGTIKTLIFRARKQLMQQLSGCLEG